jgi:hypothetical protein
LSTIAGCPHCGSDHGGHGTFDCTALNAQTQEVAVKGFAPLAPETITLPAHLARQWREWVDCRPTTATVQEDRLRSAIDAALWTAPVSQINWVACAEHPHPVGAEILAFCADCSVMVGVFLGGARDYITHWALINLPEVKP